MEHSFLPPNFAFCMTLSATEKGLVYHTLALFHMEKKNYL